MSDIIKESDFLFYNGEDGKIHAQVIIGDETVWLSHKTMGEVFGTTIENIIYHIKNIYKDGELDEKATTKEILVVQKEGGRDVSRNIQFYNLDAIIAVGYRISSYRATKFRQWATRILNEYLVKGFAMDDERLKQGNRLFGHDYFKELLERIREIRASEKMFYEKIRDLYATSVDYDRNDPMTNAFFAKVQNKVEYAIVGKTSAEIIRSRADAKLPYMGLKTFKNAKKDGKVQKLDVTVAKNYLTQDELKSLNLLVTAFLDHAEMIVSKHAVMKMDDWSERLDKFLEFNEFKILKDAGKVKKALADTFAEKQYAKYKSVQDKALKSDFNTIVRQIKSTGELPKETTLPNSEPLTEFNKKLKTALEYTPASAPIKKRGRKKITTKVCPNCGKVNDIDAEYCEGDIEVDGDIKPCGWTFDK